jgi:hypothetical protein
MHDKGLVTDIFWTDTRDMYADGLTKGIIKRDALYEIMSGTMMLRNPVFICTRRFKQLMYQCHLTDLD